MNVEVLSLNIISSNAHVLLDGLLLEVQIMKSLDKVEVFYDRYEVFNLHNRGKK
jgi:hypothetical protein